MNAQRKCIVEWGEWTIVKLFKSKCTNAINTGYQKLQLWPKCLDGYENMEWKLIYFHSPFDDDDAVDAFDYFDLLDLMEYWKSV